MKKKCKVILIVTIINLIMWGVITALHYFDARIEDIVFMSDTSNKMIDIAAKVVSVIWFLLDIVVGIGTIVYLIFKKRISDRLDLEESIINKIVLGTYFITNIIFSYIAHYIIQLTCITQESILWVKAYNDKYPEREAIKAVASDSCREIRIMNILVPLTIVFIYLLIYNFIYKWKLYSEVVYCDMPWGAVIHRGCLILYSLLLAGFIWAFVDLGFTILDMS